MEATKRIETGEDRRLKLLEYLASKGKLKPQNNSKPYLKDCTNLENTRPQISKQICVKSKADFPKGTQFGHGTIRNTEPLQYRPKAGPIPAQKTTVDKKLEKKTNILLKVQHKSQMDLDKRSVKPEGVTRITTKCTGKREQRIPQCTTQAANTKPIQKSSTRGSSCRSVHVVSNGHGHKASAVNQFTFTRKSTTERSSLMKSSNTYGSHPKQPLSMHGAPVRDRCTSKPKTTKPTGSLNRIALKPKTTDPTSAPKMTQETRNYAFKKPSQKQQSLIKPATCLKNAGSSSCSKRTIPKVTYDKQTHGHETKETNATNEIAKPCKMPLTGTNRPHTPRMAAEDRKKQLQEWLSSKGKTYKRPPMTLPPKQPPMTVKRQNLNRALWEGLEEEEEMMSLSRKVNQTLTECLELIGKGISSEDMQATLDKVPEAKRFAKYWVCKARLLEREGIFDVLDLYKQGVQCGAMPMDELRDAVIDIMKNANKKMKVVTFGPLPSDYVLAEPCEDKDIQCCDSMTCTPLRPIGNVRTPCTGDQGSAIKYQVSSLSSIKKDVSDQAWKRLTPVRRSLRIHQSAAQYPDVVLEHDRVVSSLDELLEMAETDAYMYMRNEALPEGADCIPGMINQDTLKNLSEEPV